MKETAPFEEVLDEILDHASHITGASVCLYRYDPLPRMEEHEIRRFHYSPWCRRVMNENRDACTRLDVVDARERARRTGECFLKTCHGGVTEAVIPLFREDELIALIFLGQCRTPQDQMPDTLPDDAQPLYDALPVTDADRLLRTAQLVMIALRAYTDAHPEMAAAYLRSYVSEAKRCIAAFCTDPSFTAGRVAETLGLSHEYLARIYRDRTGTTLTDAIRERRMTRAALLLKNTDLPVSQVASLCGFEDPSYFTRVFRKTYGMTPGAYRKT